MNTINKVMIFSLFVGGSFFADGAGLKGIASSGAAYLGKIPGRSLVAVAGLGVIVSRLNAPSLTECQIKALTQSSNLKDKALGYERLLFQAPQKAEPKFDKNGKIEGLTDSIKAGYITRVWGWLRERRGTLGDVVKDVKSVQAINDFTNNRSKNGLVFAINEIVNP